MFHPQSKAEEIGSNCEMIGKNGCCAFVAMWIAGYEPDDAEAIATISRAMKAKVLESDCTVLWEAFFRWITGRKIKVDFIDIKSLEDVMCISGRIAVKFSHAGKSHWVGVENGKIRFSSLERSVCVEKGRPVTARVISLA